MKIFSLLLLLLSGCTFESSVPCREKLTGTGYEVQQTTITNSAGDRAIVREFVGSGYSECSAMDEIVND